MILTVIRPTTDAVSASEANEVDTSRYSSVMVAADNLATDETVTVSAYVGNDTFKTLRGEVAGSAADITLTATDYNRVLPAGPKYRFAKAATAGACGVVLHPGQAKG